MAAYKKSDTPKLSQAEKLKQTRIEATNKIIEMLEQGNVAWQKPWSSSGTTLLTPANGKSGRRYRGANNIILLFEQLKNGYNDPRWYTFKQISEIEGAKLRKGSKGIRIEFWTDRVKDKEASQEAGEDVYKKLEKPILRYFVVFNATMIEGLEPYKVSVPTWDPVERAENIVKANGVPVIHDQGNRCFYVPAFDEIHMTPKAAFSSSSDYYTTLLHEVGHSTGHHSRLGREISNRFGTEEYAKEELRAELASMFLCRDINLQSEHADTSHAGYIKSWIKVLQEDHNEIFRAASDAEKICDYLLERERLLTKQVTKTEEPSVPGVSSAASDQKTEECKNLSAALLKKGFDKVKVAKYVSKKTGKPLAMSVSIVSKTAAAMSQKERGR
ncbi:ArdC family protein [Phascolarctobacterium sp.]